MTVESTVINSNEYANDLANGEYAIGIRPSDLTLFSRLGDGDYTATVTVTEPLSAETIVDIEVGGTGLRCITPKLFAKDLEIGMEVGVSVAFAYLYFIDDDRVVLTPERRVTVL